jgi:NAD binding domain of 6-phosphogluconate dehydrogenase
MARVGFIGLGTMGAGMARRLVDAGHEVVVWNRSRASAEPLAAAGARIADTAEEALQAGVAFSMLADDGAVLSVFTEDVLRSNVGTTHVNMATVSLGTARSMPSTAAQESDTLRRPSSAGLILPPAVSSTSSPPVPPPTSSARVPSWTHLGRGCGPSERSPRVRTW